MKEYRITIKKQLNAFTFIFYFTILFILLLGYYQYNNELNNESLFYYGIFFLISLIPVVFLHIEYFARNGNYTFIIDSENKCLKLSSIKKDEVTIIKFEDIERIVIYCAPSVRKKRNIKILPFESYHFARIFTKSHEQHVITNLLMEDIIDGFKIVANIKVRFKLRIFATALY